MSGIDDLSRFLSGGDDPQSGGTPSTLIETASVTAVTSGAAKGGAALVRVSWRGANVSAQYIASYTPVVNDLVLVVHHGDVPYILGRLTGLPA